MEEKFNELTQKYPFLSYGKYIDEYYLGIIQNCDNQLISMYVYNNIYDEKTKRQFLKLGETWWWESNRLIPINIFLRHQFYIFQPLLKTFIRKEFELIFGPTLSIHDIPTKKIKKRTIQLVKKDLM